MSTATPEETIASIERDVETEASEAQDHLASALTYLDAAIAASARLASNSEFLRRLHIARTQAQTTQLWLQSAIELLPVKP